MSTVIFTKGLPASGKSTWAKAWAAEQPGRVRINCNDLRAMMGGERFQNERESIVLAASLNILKNALRLGRDVVCDNTNLNQQTLKHYTDICQQAGAAVKYRTFYTSPEECIRRDSQREHPVGAEVIMTMFARHKKELTPPRESARND